MKTFLALCLLKESNGMSGEPVMVDARAATADEVDEEQSDRGGDHFDREGGGVHVDHLLHHLLTIC